MSKGYMIKEGKFHTNWKIWDFRVFRTKKQLQETFKKENGFQCYHSKRSCYDKDEQIYENHNEEYGYEIIEVEIYEG